MDARVPFNDLHRYAERLADRLEATASRVIRSGWYLLGPETEAFEAELAAFTGVAGCVSVANGTDALEIAMRAVGVGAGDEVVLAANAGGYATTACLAIGAVPVYADVDADLLLLSVADAAAAVTPATRAVVVTHLYGTVAYVGALRAAIPAGVAIVEDVAQAHGARRDDRIAGSMGDAATYSFYPTKNLGALGDGGAVVSSRDDVLERARALRQYGWERRYHVTVDGGRNSRLDEIQAAFLRVLLPDVIERNARRTAIRDSYAGALADRVRFVGDLAADGVATVPATHLCVVRSAERDRLVADLAEAGVATAVHFPVPDHRQPALQRHPFRHGPLDHTVRACDEVVSLPCFPELTDDEVAQVIEAIEKAT
jgi:dTDP-3-amino-2,3,6-trideoxy-4-keto-D-glucose/dTDP-3-amino-3,4,6-trideoxy-alpha-D-glucose/dTDP-2,6-dideoxy-D-kanosamine transaminase